MRWAGLLSVLIAGGFGGLSAQEDLLESLAWMSGCWLDDGPGGSSEEVWTTPAGGLLLGISRTMSGEGRVAFEYMRVVSGAEGVRLLASPGGGPATAFPAVVVSEERFRVERPDHDFPRAIEYRPLGPDSLVAEVFAEEDSPDPAFALRFERVRCPGGGR